MTTTPPLLFALLDAARMGAAMTEAKERFPDQHISLYRGRSVEALSDFAPYLFWFNATKHEPGDWFMENGWGQSWGIFGHTYATSPELYRHFRRFLLVSDERGREMYFRFYDPRVLRLFLPTCDTAQLTDFFGPVRQFILEDANPEQGLRFQLSGGRLLTNGFSPQEASKFGL